MRKTLGDLQSMVQTTTKNQATQILSLIQKVLTVPSAGWKNLQLIPYLYPIAPPDGIYEFDFVATPPPDVTELSYDSDSARNRITCLGSQRSSCLCFVE
jgi:hypothetical protein